MINQQEIKMRATKLVIKNIGKIASETIQIDKPLILFYGDIRQGKTTILNSVRWVCGGEFPTDIIRHGEKEGAIELHFDGGMIGREWYRAKDGTTKARAVTFVRGGRPVSSPVAEIKRLLNPFLLDQDHLRNKSELERKQFFAELFAVDTTELDTEWFNNDRKASDLRVEIKSFGEIDLTPVDAVNATALKLELAGLKARAAQEKAVHESNLRAINEKWEADCEAVEKANESSRSFNANVDRMLNSKSDIQRSIKEHEDAIVLLKAKLAQVIPPKQQIQPKPAAPDRTKIQQAILDTVPDTSELETKIQDAGAVNVRAEQYQANKKRHEDKTAKEEKVAAIEKRQREIKQAKHAKLKEISESSKIPELAFDDAGNFTYEGTQAGMLSTSQIMKLSSQLSALYPEGFGLELLDRGESLGRSIFEFVDRATAEKKSILATIVGEKPADVPANIGVFVVEGGKIS